MCHIEDRGCEVEGCVSESCPVTDFGVIGVEPSVFCTRVGKWADGHIDKCSTAEDVSCSKYNTRFVTV
jgi:hypothetical protein